MTRTVTETFRLSTPGQLYELTWVDGVIRIFEVRVQDRPGGEWQPIVSGDWRPGEVPAFELNHLQWNYGRPEHWPAILARAASIIRGEKTEPG